MDDKNDFLRLLFDGAREVNITEEDKELLNLIYRIQSYSEPPKRDDDIYDLRNPWQKFGGVSSGICMAWFWYRDDVIFEKATKEDILLALSELEEMNQP